MCPKTDKRDAKLNSWCEREGTMKLSRWDTFGENFNFTVSFLSCFFIFYFFYRYALGNAWKPFIISYFFFSFLLCSIYSFLKSFFQCWSSFHFFSFCFWHLAVANNTFHWILFSSAQFLLFSSSPFLSLPLCFFLTLIVPSILWLLKQ